MGKRNIKHRFSILFVLTFTFFIFLSNSTAYATSDNSSGIKAYFYLYQPSYYDEETGYVSPFSCDWAGEGRITGTNYIFNDSESVANIIISAPTVEGAEVEWVTAFKYFGYNIIIGKIVTNSSVIDEIIDETIDENTNEIIEESLDDAIKENPEILEEPTDVEEVDVEPLDNDIIVDEEPEPQLYILDRNEILSAVKDNFNEIDSVKWNSFKQAGNDVSDGIIPITLLDDPVYTSMNLPSEARSDYMIKTYRDNAHILGSVNNPEIKKLVSIGSIYQTSGAQLPDEITICLGKIKLFGYSISEQRWVTISEDSAPVDAMIYKLPWGSGVIKDNMIQRFDDHIEITVKGENLANNVLHFWGSKVPVDKDNYKYYACAYSFWVKNPEDNNLLTSVVAMDAKAATGTNTVAQLISSRGMNVQSTERVIWGSTIPNSEYDPSFGTELQSLFYE